MKISIPMLIGTIIAGLIYGVVGELFFRLLYGTIPSPLVTFVYFGGLFFFIMLVLTIINNMFYSKYAFNGKKIEKKSFLISIVLILVCTLLFEFIYDLVGTKGRVKTVDSYIFVIDNSGSMNGIDGNDPYGKRYDAIDKLIENKKDKFEFAVYGFDTEVYVLREMGPKNGESHVVRPEENGGLTYMHAALQKILDDNDAGMLDLNNKTKIVLLSDGQPSESDLGINATEEWLDFLAEFDSMGVSVNTVFVSPTNDIVTQTFMEMVAESTNGISVTVSDVDDLDAAFTKVSATNNLPRNLLGYRPGDKLTVLLGIMRVVFVVGLGLITALMKTAVCERFINTSSVFISSIVGGILAGICIEIGMNGLGVNAMLMRIVTCILVSITVLREDIMINNFNRVRGEQPLY